MKKHRTMKLAPRYRNALAAVAALWVCADFALAGGTTVQVTLWDHGPQSMQMLGKGPKLGMAMEGPGRAMPMGPMGITVASRTVKAGAVTFAVTNTSKTMIHEMVLAPVKDESKPLPYDQASLKVDEDAAGHLGEVAELEPGKKGALTIDVKPGKYILYCNMPGHYVLGMWTLITVQ